MEDILNIKSDNSIDYYKNICQECGLPLEINKFEKRGQNTDTEKIIIKLSCRNLEHNEIIDIEFEEYNNIIKNGFDKTCKCTSCGNNNNILPYYCYSCKKIICFNCFNNNIHPKEHYRKIKSYNKLENFCLLHEEMKIDYFCKICRKKLCQKCVEYNDCEHNKDKNISKIDELISNNKYNLINISNEQKYLFKKLNILNNKITFNEFLMNNYDNYFYLVNKNSSFINGESQISNMNSYLSKNISNIISSISNNSQEISNINIIYYDSNVKMEYNEDIIKNYEIFGKETNGTIILCDDLNNFKLLIQYLSNNNSKSKFFLIVNGSSSKEAIDFIKKKNYISLIIRAYIFTIDSNKYLEVKNNNFDFVKNIYTIPDEIIKDIKDDFKNLNVYNEKYYINSIIDIDSYKNKYFNLHKELSEFYGNELEDDFNSNFNSIQKFIKNSEFPKKMKKNLISCFYIFSELPKKNYGKIISCYLRNNYFSKILNLILNKKDFQLYKNIKYFAGNLMHSIVQYGKKMEKGVNKPETFYMGIQLNIVDLMEFLKNIKKIITFPYFLSVTTNENMAKTYSYRNIPIDDRKNKDFYSVIMTINYSYQEDYEPCVFDLKDLSQIPIEEEHVLLPFTFMELNEIKIYSNNYNANIKLNIIGKKEILEYKIQNNNSIEYDNINKIMVAN